MACEPTPLFNVESAADWQPPKTVSVLGVFRDGRMSPEAWENDVGADLSKPLREPLCPAGYGPSMRERQPALADAIDRGTREDGLGDELLDQVAPMAEGELVMAITLYRYVPKSISPNGTAPVPRQAGRGRGGGFGRRGAAPHAGTAPAPDEDPVYEISITFFSVAQHHLVARIDMRYSGTDMARATNELQTKLSALLPQTHCVGWNW